LTIKIKEYLKKSTLNVEYFIITILLISAFLPRTYLPYITVIITGIIYLIISRKNFYGKQYLYFAIGLIALSIISWLYNFFVYKDIDFLGLMLWWLTYLFPFLVLILVSSLSLRVNIRKVVKIYIYILLFEFFIIFFQAIQENKLWGDFATGTCWNAHALGIHFAIGIIITLSEVFQKDNKNIGITLFFLLILYQGLIITAYKAQIVILLPILVLFFFYKLIRKIIIYKKQVKKYIRYVSAFIVVLVVSVVTVMFTYVLGDVQTSVKLSVENVNKIEENYDIENWQYLERWGGKIYSYRVAFLDVPKEINYISGYGPSTYTSRASELRMKKMTYYIVSVIAPRFNLSEDKIKSISNFISKENSRVFEKYLGKIRFRSTLNAPMASVISIWVEIGVLGLGFFIFFFIYLFIRLRNARRSQIKNKDFSYLILNQYSVLLLMFFIINLFYLNYWEYPEMVIPVMTFIILSSAYGKRSKSF